MVVPPVVAFLISLFICFSCSYHHLDITILTMALYERRTVKSPIETRGLKRQANNVIANRHATDKEIHHTKKKQYCIIKMLWSAVIATVN